MGDKPLQIKRKIFHLWIEEIFHVAKPKTFPFPSGSYWDIHHTIEREGPCCPAQLLSSAPVDGGDFSSSQRNMTPVPRTGSNPPCLWNSGSQSLSKKSGSQYICISVASLSYWRIRFTCLFFPHMGLNTQTLNATFQCAPPRLEKLQHSCDAVLDEEMDIQK